MEVLGDYFLVRFDLTALKRLKDDEIFMKTNPICVMLEEIMILLNPLSYRYPRLSLISFTTLDPNTILRHMEQSFADEISAFYHMNLLKPNIDVNETKMRHKCNLEKCLPILVREVKGDPLLGNWIKKWSEDLTSVYHDIDETMKTWSSSTIFC
ncbi:MAG: hypothetical protein WBX01_00205 [Nitrososphaeraceae archaeon]